MIKLYFLFTEVKLKLHGLFQRKRHPKAFRVVHRCSIKKLLPNILQTSLEGLLIGVLFYQAAGLELYQNRNSGTGVLLYTLWNFSEQFYADQLWTAATGS